MQNGFLIEGGSLEFSGFLDQDGSLLVPGFLIEDGSLAENGLLRWEELAWRSLDFSVVRARSPNLGFLFH